MPQFLIDEDLPRSSAELLRKLGYDAVHVREVGLRGASDDEVFVHAQKEKRIIVTRDLGFSSFLDYPLGTHEGIVVFRLPHFFTAVQINKVLSNSPHPVSEPDSVGSRWPIRRNPDCLPSDLC